MKSKQHTVPWHMPGCIFLANIQASRPLHVRIFNETEKYESFSLAPNAGSGIIKEQNISNKSSGFSKEAKSATPGDLLAAVMSAEQLASLSINKDAIYSMLSMEQKRRVDGGEDLISIIEELNPEKRQQIEQLSQGIFESLGGKQKKDLVFLGSSYAFGGESLDARMAILQWMEENQREITYEDLVKLGFYAPGELEGAGRDWASTINLEYDLVYNKDASIAMLDREERLQQGMEMSMLYAMTIAPLINTAIYGRAPSPKDMYNSDSRLDSIERDGWSIKGSPSYVKAPEASENTGGQAQGTNNTVLAQLTRAQNRCIRTLNNVIENNLTEDDFGGTLADLQGNPIPNKSGGFWDHLTEMRQSYTALKNIRIGLEGSLKNPNLTLDVKAFLQDHLDTANLYIKKIEDLFQPFGGITQ